MLNENDCEELTVLQIVWNWMIIFIFPFLSGVIIRVLFRNKEKGWIVSVIIGVLSLVAAIAAVALTSGGNERLGLMLIQAVCALAGSLLTGAIIRVVKEQEKN